jgi:hypothetical protein
MIKIAEFNSSSIRAVAAQIGATYMREIASWNTDADNRPDWNLTLYGLMGADGVELRVINSNGDCVVEGEEGFAEALEQAGL